MSIGIVVDSSAKTKSKIGSEVAAAELHSSQNVKSVKDVPAESKHNGKEGMSSDLGRQNKPPRKESSPLIRRITSDQNTAYPKGSSLPSTNNVPLQPSGNKMVDNMEAGSYFASQMLNLRARDANEKISKSNFNQREGGNHGTIGREEESAKPVTRSASGKKPQAQKSVPKNQSPLCQSKQAHVDENAFSFVETWSKRSNTDVSPGFKTFKRKEREELETRPVKTSVMGEVHKDKSQKANDGRKTKAAATNTSLNVNRKRDSEVVKQNTEGVLKDKTQKATDGRKTKAAAISASSFENRKQDSEVVKPNTGMKEKTHNYFDDLMTSCQPGGNNGTKSNNDVDQNPFAQRSFTTNVDPQHDLKSPTFEFKSTTGISSPISSFESDKEDLDVDSPSDNSFKTKQTRSSHSKGSSKEGHYNANTENSSPNLPDSLPSPLITGGHKENRCSGSPSEVMETQSSEDASPISGNVYLCCSVVLLLERHILQE
nr:meiosis-specific protein ASY3 [Tanacetum cinerariifolium]